MKLLKETTVWKTPCPNHVYIFDNSTSKIAGYIPFGTAIAKKFSKPMNFDRRGRTFELASAASFNLTAMKS